MLEKYSKGEKRNSGSLEDLLPEARLREIAKMKADAEEKIKGLKSESGRERDIVALQRTIESLNYEEESARNEPRKLN